MTHWFDRLGGTASATCALHCLLMALAPSVIALLGVGHEVHGALEWLFFGSAVTFALLAAVAGYRTHHALWVLAGFVVGLLVLGAGRMSEALQLFEGGAVLAVLGGLLLVASHLASIRQTRRCSTVCCE